MSDTATSEKDGVERPVFYSEIKLSPSVENPRRLVFVAAPNSPKVPDDLVALRQAYERTARVAAVMFADERDIRKELFLILHEAADRGFRGPEFSIEDGGANLVSVQETLTDFAHTIRDQRLRSYTWLALAFGILPLAVGVAIFATDGFGYLPSPVDKSYAPLFAWTLATLWIPAGAAICVWAEFALRMQAGLSYDQLLSLDPSRWRPGQRLLITVGISFILSFLLAFDVVQVGLGGVLLNDFTKTTPFLALAVGGITGLAFIAVRDIIFRVRPTERTQ